MEEKELLMHDLHLTARNKGSLGHWFLNIIKKKQTRVKPGCKLVFTLMAGDDGCLTLPTNLILLQELEFNDDV